MKTLARMAVHKVANDPELRARISSTVQQEIVPRAKQGWENMWMPQIPQSGKTEIELERDKQYETK